MSIKKIGGKIKITPTPRSKEQLADMQVDASRGLLNLALEGGKITQIEYDDMLKRMHQNALLNPTQYTGKPINIPLHEWQTMMRKIKKDIGLE